MGNDSAGFTSANNGRWETGLEWATAFQNFYRCGWAVSFAGRNRTECTMEDRKAKQTAAD